MTRFTVKRNKERATFGQFEFPKSFSTKKKKKKKKGNWVGRD